MYLDCFIRYPMSASEKDDELGRDRLETFATTTRSRQPNTAGICQGDTDENEPVVSSWNRTKCERTGSNQSTIGSRRRTHDADAHVPCSRNQPHDARGQLQTSQR